MRVDKVIRYNVEHHTGTPLPWSLDVELKDIRTGIIGIDNLFFGMSQGECHHEKVKYILQREKDDVLELLAVLLEVVESHNEVDDGLYAGGGITDDAELVLKKHGIKYDNPSIIK